MGSAPRRASDPLQIRGVVDPSRLPEPFQKRNADWSEWEDTAKVADAIHKSTIVFACSTYLADAVAEAPLEVYRRDGNKKDIADDRIGRTVRDLFEYPNPHMSGAEFQILLVLTMCMAGYGVVEKERGALDLPERLWPLRPDWLKRQTRANGERYWVYRGNYVDRREIPDGDISIVPYYPDPQRIRYGISPAQVAAREIGIDISLTDFLKVFLDSGGIPPFVLMHPDPEYDAGRIDAMQERWTQKYGGSKAWGTMPIITGGYELKEIGGSLDEMAWPDLRGLSEQKIAQGYRVPLELVQGQMAMKSGGLETTRMEGAMAALQRLGAAPLRGRIDGALTRGVLTEFVGNDRTYDLGFDTSQILALQEDKDAKHTRVRADYDSGIIMLDEARKETDREELEGGKGQVFKIGFSSILTPIDGLIEEAPPPPKELPPATEPPALPAKSGATLERRYRDTKALTRADLAVRASVTNRTAKDRRKLIEIGSRELRKFFVAQGERVAASAVKSGAGIEVRALADINWAEEERRVRQVLMRFYNEVGKTAFAAAAELLGIEITWDITDPNIKRILDKLATNIVDIAKTTEDDVRRIVGAALDEGASVEAVRDKIKDLFEETYRNRAETIARTETMLAHNYASALSYEETGEVDEVELHDNGSHTEGYDASDGLTCAERDGLVVKLSDVSTHVEAEHPNGSLGISPILRTALGDE